MKWKALLCLATVLSMLVTVIPMTKASDTTTLAVIFADTQTPELVGPPPYPCENFTVRLQILGISNLWFWAARITWDPTILTCLEVRQGDFLKNFGSTLFPPPPIDNEKGEIEDLCCGLMTEEGATGDGILTEFDFHVEGFTAVAGMNISILDIEFLDPAEVPIPIDVVTPGWLQLLPPGPSPPNAEFVPSDATSYYVGDTVSLNAEASEPGWDSLPTPDGNTCPITSYTWYIDIGNDGADPHDFTLEGVTQSFLCEYLGDVGINLTVYAPDPVSPTDERYVPYDSELHVIHQIVKPLGLGGKIDLFTQKEPYNGRGPNVPSDAFGPEKEVKLTANLTYNDDPVSGKLVRITVIDPDNGTLLHRTSTTNGDGLATVDFRIPTNATFGTYFAIAIAEVPDPYNPCDSEKTVNDTLTFKVGWIVEIVSIKTVNENHMEQEKFTRGSHVGIELVLRNIAMTEKKITVAVAIYDCLNIPLNSTEIEDFELQPDDEVPVYYFLYIPKSARVGEAIACACVYTAPVSLGGVPYCPEVSKRFFIEVRAAPAVWEIPRWLLALLFLLAVFIGACLVAAIVFALLWMRERKKKGQMCRQPTYPEVKTCKEVGFKRSKMCSACGKEFPGAYTFCPYCFTFHGKDYE